jgi:hypothetical protein
MRLALTLASLLLLPLATAAQRADREVLHPDMVRLVDERGPSKGWVYFKDKGIRDGKQFERELVRAADRLSHRARQRRLQRREVPGLVDYNDIRVAPAYIRRVLATGVRLSVESRWLNAISVQGSNEQFAAIAQLPFVDRIDPVRRGVLNDMVGTTAELPAAPSTPAGFVGPPAAPPAPFTSAWYGLTAAQLQQLDLIKVHQRGFTGEGVVIGILDTGFHRGHEAFNQPGHVVDIVKEWDFINDDGNTGKETGDDASQHAHGTYILGTIGAYLPGTLVGAAYDASFLLAKTEDIENEYQQEEDFYVAGLEWIEANGADVATSSLGYIDWYQQSDLDGKTAVTTIGVNLATANGVYCCTAAGNGGHDSSASTSTLLAPADSWRVIACGAVDSSGNIASFSSSGPTADGRVKPELLARGVSTQTVCAFTDTDCEAGVNGTSLSTPLMAGVLGCIAEAHPKWGVGKVRNELFKTGDYFKANGTTDPLFIRGYGVPSAERVIFGRPVRTKTNGPPKVLNF